MRAGVGETAPAAAAVDRLDALDAARADRDEDARVDASGTGPRRPDRWRCRGRSPGTIARAPDSTDARGSAAAAGVQPDQVDEREGPGAGRGGLRPPAAEDDALAVTWPTGPYREANPCGKLSVPCAPGAPRGARRRRRSAPRGHESGHDRRPYRRGSCAGRRRRPADAALRACQHDRRVRVEQPVDEIHGLHRVGCATTTPATGRRACSAIRFASAQREFAVDVEARLTKSSTSSSVSGHERFDEPGPLTAGTSFPCLRSGRIAIVPPVETMTTEGTRYFGSEGVGLERFASPNSSRHASPLRKRSRPRQ
jgi:hypothetical protein